MRLDATHLAPELRAFVAKPGLFSPVNPRSLILEACHSQLPASHCHPGSWGGNENKELRHRAPHCEGNVVSQPMHFNAGKLPGTPGGCAWGLGSTAFPSFCRPGINPTIPSWARKLQEPLHQQGSPPANQGATALMLKFHKHLLTQERH